MAKEMNKEQWVDAVMGSTAGMSRAAGSAALYEKISNKLNKNITVKTISLPLRQWAAAAVLLLAVNIGSIVYAVDSNRKQHTSTVADPLGAAVHLESTYNY